MYISNGDLTAQLSLFITISLLFLLYAEVHYRLKGLWSRLYQAEPEIVADTPHRLEPGARLPVLLLVKDAQHFPIVLQNLSVNVKNKHTEAEFSFDVSGIRIDKNIWSRVFEMDLPAALAGQSWINVFVKYTVAGEQRQIRNDNYKWTSHDPLYLNISKDPLPRRQGWYYGDFHYHSDFTSDQVEFGAPLFATTQIARAMGLDFFCATDHSYDLDDKPDDYLTADPDLKKWHNFRRQVHNHNADNADFIIIPGEEVSIGNGNNKNVHLLVLNHDKFLPGSGDGAEKWLHMKPELNVGTLLSNLDNGTLTYAAHPEIKPPILERWLVGRDKWLSGDYRYRNLKGLQIWNGCDNGFLPGKTIWCDLLLQGTKLFIIAGNDAHGNFGRFRQIAFPFISMREHYDHLFGKIRTAVCLKQGDDFSLPNLMQAVHEGRMVITNGPFVDMSVVTQTGQKAEIGGEVKSNQCVLNLKSISTPEYGALTRLIVYQGDVTTRKENKIAELQNFNTAFEHELKLAVASKAPLSYLRAELYSTFGKCFTNPIWMDTKSV